MIRTLPAVAALAGLLIAGAASAQTSTAPSTALSTAPSTAPSTAGTTSAAPAAVATSDNPRTAAAPVAGANSYTEGQARARLEEKGFGNVADLKKDDKGVWRATAMKDGKSAQVALDYQGNVVSN